MGPTSVSFLSWGKVDPVVVPPQGRGRLRGTVYPAAAALVLLSAPTPRCAHGGSLAAMMDETFSKTAYLAGEGLFTLSLNVRFKK